MPKHDSPKQFNQFGLSRYIPASVKRAVRKRCGFGCVICGSIIYAYHHFEPSFIQAREHTTEGIILLCGKCHAEVTKGLLSDATINKAGKSPKCLEQGFAHFALDVGERFPVVLIGNSTFIANPTIIRAFGTRLFAIDKPEIVGGPCRISAIFYDRVGNEACRIVYNEWQGLTSTWDITCIGNEITIWRADREIALKMHSNPPEKLVIDRLEMFYKGFRINVDTEGQTTTYLPDGRIWFRLNGAVFVGNNATIVL
jgi:hypothetical protein